MNTGNKATASVRTLPSHGKGHIPFNSPALAGNEIPYIVEAVNNRHLSGDGPFTRRCHAWLEQVTGCKQALLTHSCTAALEMAALLLDLQPGDEVIMPSYTFVSTANAVVLRGAVPVFVDIRADTLNIDEAKIEAAITEKTRAIFVVHYAGVACEMDTIMEIAGRHDIAVVEDAAQGILATYNGKPLGSIGDMGCLSFHETKNIISGEGGALLINNSRFIERAHVIREKGTNRTAFFQGQVDKYTWVDYGSSYLPSEILAAFLMAQFERASELIEARQSAWHSYHLKLQQLEANGCLRRPIIPQHCASNAHIYYLLANSPEERNQLLAACRNEQIQTTFHYIPLHSAPAGIRFGRTSGELKVTDDLSARLVRLPLWSGISEEYIARVVDLVSRRSNGGVAREQDWK